MRRLLVLFPLFTVLAVVGAAAVTLAFTYQRSAAEIEANAERQLRLELARLQHILVTAVAEDRIEDARQAVAFLGALPAVAEVYLADTEDRVLAALSLATLDRRLAEVYSALDPEAARLARAQRQLQIVPGADGQRLHGYAGVRLSEGEELRSQRFGTLVIVWDMQPAYQALLGRVVGEGLVQVGGFVLVGLFLLLFWRQRVDVPLRRLTAASEAVARGEWDSRVERGADDEFGQLATAFERMLVSLREQREAIEQKSRLYRTLSEVSRAIVSVDERDALLGRVVDTVVADAGFARADLCLVEEGRITDYLGRVAGEDGRPEIVDAQPPELLEGVVDCMLRGPAVFTLNDSRLEAGSLLAIPVLSGDRLVGVLCAADGDSTGLDEALSHLLSEIADEVAHGLRVIAFDRERRENLEALRQSEENLEVTLMSIGDGVLVTDARGRLVRMNAVAEQLTGWPLAEARGEDIHDVFTITNVKTGQPVENPVDRVLAHGETVGLANHTVLHGRDGGRCHISDTAAPIRGSDESAVRGAVLVFQDVTEAYQRRAAVEASEARLRTLFEVAPFGILVLSAEGRVQQVNPGGALMFGFEPEEVTGLELHQLVPGVGDLGEIGLQRLVSPVVDDPEGTELEGVRSDDSRFPVELFLKDMQLPSERLYVAIVADITERRRREERIRQLAFQDPLTGLPNRSLLHDHLELALAQARRNGDHVVAIFIDLDGFKDINDSYGHSQGDAVLAEVARRLPPLMRVSDTVARVGGDEFVVILPDASPDREEAVHEAVEVVEKVAEAIGRPIELARRTVRLGASFGISLYPVDAGDAEVILKHADTAMYQAKSQKPGSYCFFEPRMNEEVTRRLELEQSLRDALREEAFELHYQPVLDAREGGVAGFEALLRWPHPERGWVSPEEFIPIAERNGSIVPLGAWVLRAACKQLADWRRRGLSSDCRMAVNVSTVQLLEDGFPGTVREILDETGLPADRLKLEVTETAVLEATTAAEHVIEELRGLGVPLSVDDFGTGYSSLGYLRQLPISELKIDRSFVRDLGESHDEMAIVDTIVAMASRLRLDTVAEGVETEVQAELLRRMGVTHLQGYLFSRPRPAGDVEGDLGLEQP